MAILGSGESREPVFKDIFKAELFRSVGKLDREANFQDDKIASGYGISIKSVQSRRAHVTMICRDALTTACGSNPEHISNENLRKLAHLGPLTIGIGL